MSGSAHGVTRTSEELAAWRAVVGAPGETDPGAGRLSSIDAHPTVAEIAALRKEFPAAWVAAALEWARARPKAEAKWPGRRVVCDGPGIEMATGADIARHKARRFASAGGAVLDLCCGIGGDLMGLADHIEGCEGVELDPLRAWMAETNSGCSVRTDDAEAESLEGRLVHLDPARRDASGRRTVRLGDLIPGPEFIERVAGESRGAGIKLMPGVDAADLPAGEVEYISRGGELKQAVLWTGVLGPNAWVRASRVVSDGFFTLAHALPPPAPPLRDVGPWVHTVDPSVERAGLLGVLCDQLDMGMPHPHSGLICGDRPVEGEWVRPFAVLEDMAWNRKRVRTAVRAAGGGIVEVKTRGRVVDADAEARALRGDGDRVLTVFVLRIGSEGVRAIIAERIRSED